MLEATRDDLGFHSSGSVFWKRTNEDGTVRVQLARPRLDGSDTYDVDWAFNLDAGTWASIVASVSARDYRLAWPDAVALHMSPHGERADE